MAAEEGRVRAQQPAVLTLNALLLGLHVARRNHRLPPSGKGNEPGRILSVDNKGTLTLTKGSTNKNDPRAKNDPRTFYWSGLLGA
eukprot:9165462-Heterocapsa_arctica.AAC.1